MNRLTDERDRDDAALAGELAAYFTSRSGRARPSKVKFGHFESKVRISIPWALTTAVSSIFAPGSEGFHATAFDGPSRSCESGRVGCQLTPLGVLSDQAFDQREDVGIFENLGVRPRRHEGQGDST